MTLPWAFPPAELPLLEDAPPVKWDCLVVGCGGAACYAALELARSGAKVGLLWESGQEARLLRLPGMALPCLADHYWSLVQGVGREQSALWWQLAAQGCAAVREHIEGSDQEHAVTGSAMLLAVNAAELGEMTRGLGWMGLDGLQARMMGAAAASNYVSVAEVEAGLFLAGAATFEPSWWQQHLLSRLQAAGVVCFSTKVNWQVEGEPNLVAGSLRVCAESMLIANGLNSLNLLQVERPWLFPMRGQSLLSTPIRPTIRSSVVAVTANRCHEFYREWNEGMVVAGLHPGAGVAEMSTELKADVAFCERLLATAGRRLTEMENASFIQRWATVYDLSMDGLPVVGTVPGQARVWLAAGFATCEWSLGPACGQEIALALQGSESKLSQLSSANPRRFSFS